MSDSDDAAQTFMTECDECGVAVSQWNTLTVDWQTVECCSHKCLNRWRNKAKGHPNA